MDSQNYPSLTNYVKTDKCLINIQYSESLITGITAGV